MNVLKPHLDGRKDSFGFFNLADIIPNGGNASLRLCQAQEEQPGKLHVFYFICLHRLGHPVIKNIPAGICYVIGFLFPVSLAAFLPTNEICFAELCQGCLNAACAVRTNQRQVLPDKLLKLITGHRGEDQQAKNQIVHGFLQYI